MNHLPDFKEEKKLWRQGYAVVIGVDEVGRGAFAGPLVASACAFAVQGLTFKQGETLKIDDSKRLTPQQRKRAAVWIKKNCLAYGVGKVGVRTIDRVGIGKATELAMRRAVWELLKNCGWEVRSGLRSEDEDKLELALKTHPRLTSHISPPFLLVDAFHIKYLRGIGLARQKAIKKGDQKSISIAAASILAKVYRDRLMQELTAKYRKYRWARNKGYGTKKHQEEILKNGITPFHRKQFIQTFISRLQGPTLRG